MKTHARAKGGARERQMGQLKRGQEDHFENQGKEGTRHENIIFNQARDYYSIVIRDYFMMRVSYSQHYICHPKDARVGVCNYPLVL